MNLPLRGCVVTQVPAPNAVLVVVNGCTRYARLAESKHCGRVLVDFGIAARIYGVRKVRVIDVYLVGGGANDIWIGPVFDRLDALLAFYNMLSIMTGKLALHRRWRADRNHHHCHALSVSRRDGCRPYLDT